MTAVAALDGEGICATYVHGVKGSPDCTAVLAKRLAASPLADIPACGATHREVEPLHEGDCCIATAVISTSKPDFRRTVQLLDSENPGNSFLVARDPVCGPRECGRAR